MLLNNFNNLILKLIACYKEQINSNLLPYRTVQKLVCANLFNPNFDVFANHKLLLKWKRNRPVAYTANNNLQEPINRFGLLKDEVENENNCVHLLSSAPTR